MEGDRGRGWNTCTIKWDELTNDRRMPITCRCGTMAVHPVPGRIKPVIALSQLDPLKFPRHSETVQRNKDFLGILSH